jgi:hypothetical protein
MLFDFDKSAITTPKRQGFYIGARGLDLGLDFQLSMPTEDAQRPSLRLTGIGSLSEAWSTELAPSILWLTETETKSASKKYGRQTQIKISALYHTPSIDFDFRPEGNDYSASTCLSLYANAPDSIPIWSFYNYNNPSTIEKMDNPKDAWVTAPHGKLFLSGDNLVADAHFLSCEKNGIFIYHRFDHPQNQYKKTTVNYPILKMDCGYICWKAGTGSSDIYKVNVTFNHPFKVKPKVFVSASSTSDKFDYTAAGDITTTGFTAIMRRTNNYSTDGFWLAVSNDEDWTPVG